MGKVYTLTQEEIYLFSKSPSQVQVAHEKTEKTGDADALAEFDSFKAVFNNAHDSLTRWLLVEMDGLYKHASPDATRDVMMDYFRPSVTQNAKDHYDISFRDRVVSIVNGIRLFHDVGIIFDGEDDKKLTFHMDCCSAGQMLLEEGWYDEPRNITRCPASHMTAGIDNFPIYCAHDPIIDMAWMTVCGYPKKVLDYADPVASCPCKYVVYKNKEDIPEYYFTRVGFEKPKSGTEKK